MSLQFSGHISINPRVTIVGSGNVGSTVAQRLVEKNIADVVLIDIVEGRPQGVALDLMQARGVERHDRQILGTNDYADTANSDIVVITAGLPRKPGMSRDDLLLTNAKIVRDVAQQVMNYSPDTTFIVVTNPLDVMTYVTWKTTGLPVQRVMGMAGVLDSARFQTFVANELGVSIAEVNAIVLGSHGDLMVPLPRYTTVNGIPITELMSSEKISALVQRTRQGGAEIVALLKTGSAYYAPASSTVLMVESVLRNEHHLLPVTTHLQGEYGLNNVFTGVPCRLGQGGIEKIVQLALTPEEQDALRVSAETVQQNIDRLHQLLAEAGLELTPQAALVESMS